MDSGGQHRPPSGFPPSLGPGAQPIQPGESAQSMIRQIQEMRKQYYIAVEPSTLNISYVLNGNKRDYSIAFDNVPLSGFRKWVTYGGSARSSVSGTFLLDMIRGAENMTGRPLTQREVESFTFHSAKRMQYGFVGMAVALGAGYGMAARGAKEMKFPFRKPKPMENYDAFPLKRMPLLKGQYARIAWQTTRANYYAALSIILLSPIFRSMGESVMGVGLYRDERTRDAVKAIKGGFDRIRMNRTLPGSSSFPAQSQQQSEDQYGSTDAQSSYDTPSKYSDRDSFPYSQVDTGVLSDSATSQLDSTYTQQNRLDPGQRRGNETAMASTPSQKSTSTDFFFDEASPTARNDPDMSTAQSRQRTGGSVWTRIRQGSPNSTSASPPPQAPQNPSSNTDQTESGWQRPGAWNSSTKGNSSSESFSFSSSDSNRALAKEQAQKEFDDMLDRERRGSGSEDINRGSFAAEAGNESSAQSRTRGAWGQRRG